ncbi:MAG: hypothetical protein MI673_10860 [Thiotrichales bacterium]|nr:hypothetical protein [Thiotrichales bacterium]
MPDHIAVLYLDGSEVGRGNTTAFNLENLDRGTHTLSVTIHDNNEKQLIASDPVTFTLHRHSIQHPPPPPPPP